MPIVRIYVRPIHIENWPGVPSVPLIEFDPIPDDNAGQEVLLDRIKAIPGKCYPSDVEIPDGFTVVETFPGHKHIEAPDGTRMSAGDVVDALVKGKSGYRLVGGGGA